MRFFEALSEWKNKLEISLRKEKPLIVRCSQSTIFIFSVFLQKYRGVLKKNLGTFDRVIRLVIAVIIAIAYLSGWLHGIIGTILLVLAGIITITGLIGWCPIYAPFGLNTCKVKEIKKKTPQGSKVRS